MGKPSQRLTPLLRVGGNPKGVRKSCCCSEVSDRASPVGSFSQQLQGSLHRALQHVHLGWDPPSAALAVLLTPSGTRHRNFLQSPASVARRELPLQQCPGRASTASMGYRGTGPRLKSSLTALPCQMLCLSAYLVTSLGSHPPAPLGARSEEAK